VDTHLRHGVEGRGSFASAARRGIGGCMRPSDNDAGPIPLWHPAQVGARCNVPLLTQAAVETPVRWMQRGSRRTEPLWPLDTERRRERGGARDRRDRRGILSVSRIQSIPAIAGRRRWVSTNHRPAELPVQQWFRTLRSPAQVQCRSAAELTETAPHLLSMCHLVQDSQREARREAVRA
jgi:hypothetical protein